VEAGWNILVGSDTNKIVKTVDSFVPSDSRPLLYGDGFAAAKCVDLLGEPSRQQDGLNAQSILTESV